MLLDIFIHTSNALKDSLINSGIFLVLTAATGLIVGTFSQLLNRLLSFILGSRAAFIFSNFLTIPGVLHHELSHSIAAILTGAKVTNFSIIPKGNTLGHVVILPRGPKILQGLQLSFFGVAPVLFGMFTLYCSYSYIYPKFTHPIQKIIFWYLFLCVALHMTLSGADWMSFFRGILGTYVIILIVFVLTRIVRT